MHSSSFTGIIMSRRNRKNIAGGSKVRNLNLLETMRVQNGELQNVHFHNHRFNNARLTLFGIQQKSDLKQEISIPGNLANGKYKCRLVYSDVIQKVEFEVYRPKRIESIKLVESNAIAYEFKYEDRSKINELYENRGDFDDVLIIKNGHVTDTSYANIVFYDGLEWVTSIRPLLNGTCRKRLISENKIVEKEIRVGDLKKFQKARIINAMMDLNDSPDILMESISWNH